MDNLKFLSKEPIFWSRIGMAEDPTQLDDKGNVKFYSPDWTEYIEEHKAFLEKGVKIHTSILHNGWIGAEQYDYRAVDKTLDAICGISKDILYMPRIKLNAPIDWCLKNPSEVCLTFNAPKTSAKIEELIRKTSPFYTTSGTKASAPFENGWAGLQSFASDKWLNDASEALKRLINHIETGKYGKQIIGYHIGFGQCAEDVQWGTWYSSQYWGDFSECNRKRFEKASGFREIPLPEKRCHTPENLEDFFRTNNPESIAYSEYTSKLVATRICEFAHIIKNHINKPVGAFYGYVFSSYTAEIGHTAIDTLLNCDDIDFIASPKGYYRSGAGEPGGTQATSMSVMHKKLWLDELDNDTYIAKLYHAEINHPKSFEETHTILWREVVKNLTWHDQNFWWMDLNGGWFSDEEIMSEIEKLVKLTEATRKSEHKSVSEILFVVDNESLNYHNCDKNLMGAHHKGVCNELMAELHLCGAPVDECRLNDLAKMNLQQYKMIVFANAFCVDDKTRKLIRALNAVCLWHYTPGIRNPEYRLSNVADLTGMSIKAHKGDFSLCNDYGVDVKLPPVCIEDGYDKILSKYPDGAVKIAQKQNHILSCTYSMKAEDLHDLASKAGVKMYAPAKCTVYADNRIVGIFPNKNIIGKLSLPANINSTEVTSSIKYINDTSVNFKEKSVLVFKRI